MVIPAPTGPFEPAGKFPRDREFLDIIGADPLIACAIHAAAELDLPNWRIVSGALYQSVWNHLTGRPSGYGLKDIDLFYFDDSDLSYAAEDRVIKSAESRFSALAVPLEIRNQARVHLWYENHFGHPCKPISSCEESIGRFASRTHAVGVWLAAGAGLQLVAPYGVGAIFEMRIVPNPATDNRATHEEKARRHKQLWPEIRIEPWPCG